MSWALTIVLVLGILLRASSQEGDGDGSDHRDVADDYLSTDQLRRMHAMFDMNSDGKVSLQEIMAFSESAGKAIASKDVAAILEEIDTDKDGSLSLEEHMNDIHNQADGGDEEEMKELEHRKGVESAKFKAADVNADGKLDKNELPSLFYPEVHEGVLTVTVSETMRQKDLNGDGMLTAEEFWEAGVDDVKVSEEENADFAKMDIDSNGFLDVQEIRAWESGRFATEDSMRKLFEEVDKDNDLHITSDELAMAADAIAGTDAHFHLVEWAEHHEL